MGLFLSNTSISISNSFICPSAFSKTGVFNTLTLFAKPEFAFAFVFASVSASIVSSVLSGSGSGSFGFVFNHFLRSASAINDGFVPALVGDWYFGHRRRRFNYTFFK
jgi:hypothetical protein